MSELPPPTPVDSSVNYQSAGMVDRDTEHMKILAIFWYIISGISAIGGFVPVIYIVMGAMFLLGKMGSSGGSSGSPADEKFAGIMFLVMGGCGSLFIWVGAVLAFFTARSLGQRRRYVLCLITAGFACLSIPFGTVLGVFTFILLFRPTIRSTFP